MNTAQIPVTARTKIWVYGHLSSEIAGSSPARRMDGFLLLLLFR